MTMGRACTVCSHLQRADIDAALRDGGMSFRSLAEAYGLTKPSLIRHRNAHLACTPVTELAPVRQRVRHARSPEAATLSPPQPLAARVRQAMRLRARGLSNEEVAAELHVHPSTVSNWFADARRERVAELRRTTAEEIVADHLADAALWKARVWEQYELAAAQGDTRASVACLRLVDDHQHRHMEQMRALGAFNAFRPATPPPFDHDEMHRELEKFAAECAKGPPLTLEDIHELLRAPCSEADH